MIERIVQSKGEVFIQCSYTDTEQGYIPFGLWLTVEEQAQYEASPESIETIMEAYKDTATQLKIDSLNYTEEEV